MRHRFSLVAAAALVLAACSDDPGTSPTGVGPVSDFSAVTATCEPATIRYTLANLLTDGGAKAFAIPRFNAGQQADAAGNAALAEQEYFRVASHVLDRYVRGGTAQPKRYESVQAAVVWVVVALYDCADAELPIPLEDLEELIDDIGGGGPTGDIGIGIVGPGIDFDILVASRQFSFRGEGNFWDEAAIVIVRRIPDAGDWSDGVYHEHPPRYNITIEPYTAQANFDDDGDNVNDAGDVVPPSETGPDVTALVSICPGVGHEGDHEEWFILRRPEPFLGGGVEALPQEAPDPDVICDETLPTYPSPTASAGFARRGLASLRGAASAFLDMLGPASLYAVDGGIGGRVRLASDYVSALNEGPEVLNIVAGGESPVTSESYNFGTIGNTEVFSLVDGDNLLVTDVPCTFTLPAVTLTAAKYAFVLAGPAVSYATGTVSGNTVTIEARALADVAPVTLSATCGTTTVTTELVTGFVP